MQTHRRTSTFVLAIILVVAWMCFIFYMSALVADDSSAVSGGLIANMLQLLFGGVDPDLAASLEHPVRKLAHFTEYTVLGILLANAFRAAGISDRRMALAWVIGTVYAASDEIHQGFVPGRSPQVTDVCIDACGVLLGVVILALLLHLVRKKRG